jgi:hypothetical protein
MSPSCGIALAVVHGLCMVVVTVPYRMGSAHGVGTRAVALNLSLIVGGWFAFEAGASWTGAPALVIALGLLCGCMQYLNVVLIGAALARGPLSPLRRWRGDRSRR